jgi:hypothetical protein
VFWAMKMLTFVTRSKPNQSSKHLSPFTKLVEGYLVYNFAICIWVHFVQGFEENFGQNYVDRRPTPISALERDHARDAARLAPAPSTPRPPGPGRREPARPPSTRGRADHALALAPCCPSRAEVPRARVRAGPLSPVTTPARLLTRRAC